MSETPPSTETGDSSLSPAKVPGALSDRHRKYAEDFKQWMLGLNRHDFAQVRGVLEKMTRAYFKHTVKVHSPPMRAENNDDPGKTSDGAAGTVLRDPDPAA